VDSLLLLPFFLLMYLAGWIVWEHTKDRIESEDEDDAT